MDSTHAGRIEPEHSRFVHTGLNVRGESSEPCFDEPDHVIDRSDGDGAGAKIGAERQGGSIALAGQDARAPGDSVDLQDLSRRSVVAHHRCGAAAPVPVISCQDLQFGTIADMI